MADIKLQLSGLGIELDVPQDRDFPLSLNFTAGSMKDIESRSSDYTLEFRVPATKQNKSALGHIDSTNVVDGKNVLGKNDCVVLSDGLPIFNGKLKILGVVDDRGHQEFNCIILGTSTEWVEGMRDKTPQDYNWSNSNFVYTESNVQNTWTNDYTDGYTFPLINYGAWKYADRLTVEDFRPAMFLRTLWKKAFEDEDYIIQMDTDEDDFFHSTNNPDIDKIIIPYTGSSFRRSEEDVAKDKFEAKVTSSTSDTYTASFRKVKAANAFPFTMQPNYNQTTYTIKEPFLDAGVQIPGKTVRRLFFENLASPFNLDSSNYVRVAPSTRTTFYTDEGNTLETPSGEIARIVDTGVISSISLPLEGKDVGDNFENITYIDIITSDVSDNLGEYYVNANETNKDDEGVYVNYKSQAKKFNVQIIETTGGDEDGDVITYNSSSVGASVDFNTTTGKYTASEYISARFNFSATFTAYVKRQVNVTDALITSAYNTGIFTFKVLHQSGSTITEIGEEFYNATETSNIDQYLDEIDLPLTKETILPAVYRIGFDSDVVELAPNDTVWVELEIQHENTVESLFHTTYNTICNISNASFKSIPQIDIIDGADFDLSSVLDDRYKTIDYIKGTIHAFNLMIQTDKYSKKIIIKTRDNFYDQSTALDWTDKVDSKKQYVIEYLDHYNRYLDFGFQDDSADGFVTEVSKITGNKQGSYTEDIGERFEEDRQPMINPLFAYTAHMTDKTIQSGREVSDKGIHMARMWKEYATNNIAPPKSYNFRPRLLFYTNEAQADGVTFKYYDSNISTVPAALSGNNNNGFLTPNFDVDLHLGYNNGVDNGLVSTYYETSVNIIEKGVRVQVPMIFNKKDIQTFDITKRIYLSYPEELRGYWIVDSIKNYMPATYVTTEVELIKDDNYATRNVALGSIAPSDEEIKDWVWEGQDAIDIGNVDPGKGKFTAEQIQAALDKSMKKKGGDGSGGYGTAADVKDLIAAISAGQIFTNASDAKFSRGQLDYDAERSAKEAYKREGWVNHRNVTGISGIAPLSVKKYETSFKMDNINPSMVQRNIGNRSIGAGNTVLGKGNVAVGAFQTAVGKYNKPSMHEAFSVGTGSNELERNTAFSVGLDGIVREGGGVIVEDINDEIKTVYEEINGELVKITL